MQNIYHLDYETRSGTDLIKYGSHRYAEDPDCQILMVGVARHGEEPEVFVHDDYIDICSKRVKKSSKRAKKLLKEIEDDRSALVFAHNASFEHPIAYHRHYEDTGCLSPGISQWRCTQVAARLAALPYSLGPLAEELGLDEQKDKRGKQLIAKFSVPQDFLGCKLFIHPSEDPEGFEEFIEYCRQDVRTEMAIHDKLMPFAEMFKGTFLKGFLFDLGMNLRGIPVNIEALKVANDIINEETGDVVERFRKIVGLNPTQTVKCQVWFNDRGYPHPNLKADSMEQALADPTWGEPEVVQALRLRQMSSYAAVKKIPAMLDQASDDGRVRGTMFFAGAGTARWTARRMQPQNFKRPGFKGTEEAFDLLMKGDVDSVKLIFGEPIEVMSSCIRHFISHPTRCLFDADYSSVEARYLCWLADEEDALNDYRNGVDRYVKMASYIYGVPQSKVTEYQRMMGKQVILGCGYQMWIDTFIDTCAKYKMEVDEETALLAVSAFRDAHPKVVQLWADANSQAIACIRNIKNGVRYDVGTKLWFDCAIMAGRRYLRLHLPSGRFISYPDPDVKKVTTTVTKTIVEDGKRVKVAVIDPKTGKPKTRTRDQVQYYGQLPNSQRWGRCNIYGGKFIENADQGGCADLMMHGASVAVKKGYQIFAVVHDQALCPEVYSNGRSIEGFCEALSDLPDYAEGMPLVAEGKVTPFYTK